MQVFSVFFFLGLALGLKGSAHGLAIGSLVRHRDILHASIELKKRKKKEKQSQPTPGVSRRKDHKGGGSTRHSRSRKKEPEKGDVGVEKEREKVEGEKAEKLASFFGAIYEFLSDFKNFDATKFLCNSFVDASSYVPSSSFLCCC